MARVRRRSRLLSRYVTIPLSITVVLICGVMWYELDDERKEDLLSWKLFPSEEAEAEVDGDEAEEDATQVEIKQDETTIEDDDEWVIDNLKEKYASIPDFFNTTQNSSAGPSPQQQEELLPFQFLHLHHMKTGGTSMDALLKCAMDRLKKDGKYKVPYFNIHECSEEYYASCTQGHDQRCLQRSHEASIMSYCAPLKDLPIFGWNNKPSIGSITVLRHPVNRVWSMYRFQTKHCYQCHSLLDVYKAIDDAGIRAADSTTTTTTNDNTTEWKNDSGYKDMCVKQLLNHETANLLSTAESSKMHSPEEQVQEAIFNLKNYFTLIGLTEDLAMTVEMAVKVFPWMEEHVEWSDKECPLPHRNASPANNHCGPGGKTHLELPDHPDDETRRVIEEHNQYDIMLYEAAVRHFELQKRALEMN